MTNLTTFKNVWSAKLNTLDGKKARYEKSWSVLLDYLESKNPDPKEVQKKLDALPYKSLVKKYGLEACLQEIVNAFPTLDYTKVVEFTPTLPNQSYATTINTNSSGFRYTSPHFHCSAKVCCITANSLNCVLGFIQICNSRVQKHIYNSGNNAEIENGWRFTQNPPLSDSASQNIQPWYCAGVGHGCNHPTAAITTPKAQDHVYWRELDDNFNNAGLDLRAQVGPNMVGMSSLKKVIRTQEFTAWLALKNQNKFHLIKKVVYKFDFILNVNVANNTVNPVSNNVISTNTDCTRTESLPAAALSGPTCNGVDQFYSA